MGQGHPSEKYDFVNWDDDIPNINGKIKLMATKPPTNIWRNPIIFTIWEVFKSLCRPIKSIKMLAGVLRSANGGVSSHCSIEIYSWLQKRLCIPIESHYISGWWFEPLWKILVRMISNPIYGKIKLMFQTTNQHMFPKNPIGVDKNCWEM